MSEQKNRFTYRGTVHELGPVQNFNSGFHKRELVCKTTGGKYTDYAVFTAKNDTCDTIGTLKPGDDVTVDFALDGHEWDGPKGKKWFGGATALKVELASGVNAGSLNRSDAPTAESEGCYTDTQTIDDAVADDMPF